MDSASELLLAAVNPVLASRIRALAGKLAADDPMITLEVSQGLRSWNQQQTLWQLGRDSEGNIIDPHKVVTKAPPGYSQHNFGLAVDVYPLGVDNLPDWNANHPVWKQIIGVGESLGLYSGAEFRTFPDLPHFQLTGKWPVTPDDEQRQTFKDGGISAVWAEAGL